MIGKHDYKEIIKASAEEEALQTIQELVKDFNNAPKPKAEEEKVNPDTEPAATTATDIHYAIKGTPPKVLALHFLKRAGATAEEAAEMLASHSVGLGFWDITKSTLGIDKGYLEAIIMLISAGYSTFDAVTAIIEHKDYRTVIGLSVLSMIATMGIGKLSAMADLGDYISIAQGLANLGFAIAEGDVSYHDVLGVYPKYKYINLAREAIDIIW